MDAPLLDQHNPIPEDSLVAVRQRTLSSTVSSGNYSPKSSPMRIKRTRSSSLFPSMVERRATDATNQVSTHGDMEMVMNQTLKLFILHFFVLYITQVVMQSSLIIIDYAKAEGYIQLGIHSMDFLTAADTFIVLLFVIEVGVQFSVTGIDEYFKRWWNRFDVIVLVISVVFVIVDIAQTAILPCDFLRWEYDRNNKWHQDFELARDALRMLRLGLFIRQLLSLLNSPLEHLAMLAEDLENDANNIKEFI